MRHLSISSVLALALLATAPTAVILSGEGGVQATARKVYVTVTDKDGAPVVDMKSDEFEVKENGKVQEATAKVADAPIHMAVLIADKGTGAFQLATLRLLEPLVGKGDFSFVGISPQPETLMEFTGDARAIETGLGRVGRRGGAQQGEQVVEAIMETAKKIHKDGARPVIVVMRTGTQAPTPIRADAVRDEIRKSGAILYVLSTSGTQGMQKSSQATGGVTASSASKAMSNDEQNEGMMTLGTVLGEGAKDSGGRHEQNVGTTLVPAAQGIAKELLNQYEISYTLPAGTKPSDKLQVTSKRKGVTLRAPSRIAN